MLKVFKTDYSIETSTSKFDIPKEKTVLTVSKNNSLKLISVKKNSSEVSIHEFTKDLIYRTSKYTFPKIGKKKSNDKTIPISKLLLGGVLENISFNIKKNNKGKHSIERIDNDLPNPISVVAKKSKVYIRNNFLVFTFDNDPDETQVVTLDLVNETLEESLFSKKKLVKKVQSHNSFLYKNYLFQVVSNGDELKVEVKDLLTKKITTEFVVKKGELIDFKSTPIEIAGGLNAFTENRDKEHEKTSKFLRNTNNNNIGISLYELKNGNLNLTIGGYEERTITQRASIAGVAGVMGPLAFSLAISVYSSHTYNKSTFFSSHINSNFEKVNQELPVNPFQKIEGYENKLTGKERTDKNKYFFGHITEPVLKNIFKFRNKFYFCYVDSREGTYKIIEFEESL